MRLPEIQKSWTLCTGKLILECAQDSIAVTCQTLVLLLQWQCARVVDGFVNATSVLQCGKESLSPSRSVCDESLNWAETCWPCLYKSFPFWIRRPCLPVSPSLCKVPFICLVCVPSLALGFSSEPGLEAQVFSYAGAEWDPEIRDDGTQQLFHRKAVLVCHVSETFSFWDLQTLWSSQNGQLCLTYSWSLFSSL